MPAITLSPKVVSELHSLLTKPNACVTLGDADVLFDLAGRPLAELNTVWTICARIPVNSGEEKALEDQLIPGTTLGLAYPGVHFARLVLVPSRTHLVLAVIFDQSRELAINLLVRNAATLGPVLTHCTGYPANAAADPVALGAYLITHDVASRLFYVKYRWPQNVVAESVRLRRSFLSLLCDWELDLSAERDQRLPYRFDDFLVQNRQTPAPSSPPTSAPPSPPPVLAPHATNTLTMVHPIKPGALDVSSLIGSATLTGDLKKLINEFNPLTNVDLFNLILAVGQFKVHCQRKDPLSALHTLHFARISLIYDAGVPKMLFGSVYDGDFDQYVLDFGSRVADEIDAFWGLCVDYPPKGCKDVANFVNWMKSGTVDAPVFHRGHEQATVREIEQSTQLRKKLLKFCASAPFKPGKLPNRLRKFIKKNQALLT